MADRSYRVGDVDASQTTVVSECLVTDSSYRVGDSRVLAANNQSIRGGLINCITVVARIKCCIATFYHNAGQPSASSERPPADGSDRIRDLHARQSTASSERLLADRSYRVGGSIVGDTGWDSHRAMIATVNIFPMGYFGLVAVDVVIDTIDLEVVGRGDCGH